MCTWRSAAILACLSAVGCGGPRPETGDVCNTPQKSFVAGAVSVTRVEAPGLKERIMRSRLALGPGGACYLEFDRRNDVFVHDLQDSISHHGTDPYHVLALSAGGQWGAYGAGVLAGLHAVHKAPNFDLVTGISTGAMLAPLMFLDDYEAAKTLYTNVTDDDVYRSRSYIELIRANSLVDTAPLREKVSTTLSPEIIARIKKENVAHHRVLAVQAVDLDTGTSVIFDLTAIAAETYRPCGKDVSPRDCVIHAVMAAGAIPVAFPPEFINGDMYADGGVRQHGFSLKLVQEALHRPNALGQQMMHPEVQTLLQLELGGQPEPDALPIDLTLIANTDFVVSPQCVRNGFLDVAARTAGVALDQLSIGSFYRVMAETLEQKIDKARFTYADPLLNRCQRSTSASPTGIVDAFDTHYMRCLFKAGCVLASAGDKRIWHYHPDDLPQSPVVGVPRREGGLLLEKAAVPEICEGPD
jgi:hypothetical protein